MPRGVKSTQALCEDAGTIMVDALVAVVIVSLMAASCVLTLALSRKLAASQVKARQARLTLQSLMEVTPRSAGHYAGTRDGLAFVVTVSEAPAGSAHLCRLQAVVRAKGHSYGLEGTRWCQARRMP